MSVRAMIDRFTQQEDLNFLLTNRIPRRLATRFMGWFSKIENPLVRDLSIGVWRAFSDLDLSEAKTDRFASMHDCFIRELKEGARPIATDNDVLVSPCDAIVGATGIVSGATVIQAKGFPYALADLLSNAPLARRFEGGRFVTLRLTSSMYHRFHAPCDLRVKKVTYISGDTWNVNPIALKRVERLFCKNERAVLECEIRETGHQILLVPVAAILVASIRLHFLNVLLHLNYRGPNVIPCDTHLARGQEMGWFEHGSTIIVFAPEGFDLYDNLSEGSRIRMGEPLLRVPRDHG